MPEDVMVQEQAPTRASRYTPKSPVEPAPDVPVPYLAVATATVKAAATHKVTTHAGIGALGFFTGLLYGKEFGNSRLGHLRRAVTGKPSTAKQVWRRVKGWF